MSETQQAPQMEAQSEASLEQQPAQLSQQADALENSASAEELEQKMEDAGLSEKEKQSMRKKFQLKVNNKVRDIEVDLGNEEEVKKYLQKALAADEKFQESAAIRKMMENLVLALKTDPLSVLSHPDLGVNVKELAEKVLAKELEDAQKSPEQKKIEELERILREKEEMAKKLEEEKYAAELQKLEQQIFDDLNNQIVEALKTSSLPKTTRTVRRIGSVLRDAIMQGYDNITVKDIIPFVEQQYYAEINELLDSVDDSKLASMMEKLIGKKNLDRYRKSIVSKIKNAVPNKPQVVETKNSSAKEGDNKKVESISVRDLMTY